MTGTRGYAEGAGDFIAAIDDAPEAKRPVLRRLCEWALSLEHQGLARLRTTHGQRRLVLVPRLLDVEVGLAKIWTDGARLGPSVTVLERRAPKSLTVIKRLVSPERVGEGSTIRKVSDELLQAVTEAYREAASRKVGS